MNKAMLIIFGIILVCGTAIAETSEYGLSLGYGDAKPDIYISRVGIKKDFDSKWCVSNFGCISGYFELSLNHWEWDNDEIDAVAFSPVFVYYFGDESNEFRPYIEGGIGVAYLDKYRIADRNLSSNFQFEDRIGCGFRNGTKDFNFRYMHYSNASIEPPNHGIDILLFTFSVLF